MTTTHPAFDPEALLTASAGIALAPERIPVKMLEFPPVLDNTNVSTFATCRRKWFWGHLIHLRPLDESIHLHAGAAYATAHEAFRKAYWTPDSPTYKDIEESLIPAIRAFWLAYGYDDAKESFYASSNKSPERMLAALVNHYLVDFNPVADNAIPVMIDGKPAVEISFALDLEIEHPNVGGPIQHHGRLDMLVEYLGAYFVFDDKTCSQLGPSWYEQWDSRSQFTGYVLGVSKYGFDISGAIVRGHCFRKNDVEFTQAISRRAKWQIDEWYEDTHQIVHSMVAHYQQAKDAEGEAAGKEFLFPLFPADGRFNGACSNYGGCPYCILCSTDKPHRYFDRFEVRQWDPRNKV